MKKHFARIRRVRKRIKLLVILGFFLYVSALSQFYAAWFVYPNTTVAGVNISQKTGRAIDRMVDTFSGLPYRMRVQNREYTYSLSALGVTLDKTLIRDAVFARNRKPFPLNALALLRAFIKPVAIRTPLVFTQDFTYFIDQTIFDFSQSPDAMYFDEKDQSLVYIQNEERYRIDEEYFKELLIDRVGNNTLPLYPKLTKIRNVRAEQAADTATRIKQIFLHPLTVLVDASGNSESFLLTEADLAQMVTISLSPDQTDIAIDVKEELLTSILNDQVKRLKFLVKGNVVTPKVVEDMTQILRARFAGRTIDALTISLDNGPNTTGNTAQKYIEVDISQQKMFLFKDAKLFKTYRVSTGLEYPTPTGEFAILNKTGLGYSTIYNVWMAWWMGFAYSDKLHAYFGIHELPYTLSGEDKIHRPADFIGKPNTGGCVALGVGDAAEVYRFADIGTKVVIYN